MDYAAKNGLTYINFMKLSDETVSTCTPIRTTRGCT
jgi:hypothetical protein